MAKKEKVAAVSEVVDVDCSVAGQAPDQVPDVSLVLSVDRLREFTNDIRRIVGRRRRVVLSQEEGLVPSRLTPQGFLSGLFAG
jgi:hypothetical protein